jgi:hypothetical protein
MVGEMVIFVPILFLVSFCASFLPPFLPSFLVNAVVLLASSPAYFRGFTLIALKEGREGTAAGHYAGQFQVRIPMASTTSESV